MARKSSMKKKKEQAVMSLFVRPNAIQNSSQGSTVQTSYIDISQCVSLLNRRFYRQGLHWSVKNIKLMTEVVDTSGAAPPVRSFAPPSGKVSVSKLPTTWVFNNSWTKGFKAWQETNKMALEQSEGSLLPKFTDFKIHLDNQHSSNGFSTNLRPMSLGFSATETAAEGSWDPSLYVIPIGASSPGNASEFTIIGIGQNFQGGAQQVSLVHGYSNSRALPSALDPNTPAQSADADGATPENWLAAITNQGTDQDSEVLTNLKDQNEKAPYPFERDGTYTNTMYPGGRQQLPTAQVHAVEPVTGTTVGGTTYIQGGDFPCGLIRFDIENYSDASEDDGTMLYMLNTIQIDLVAGDHRGYKAISMLEA